MGHTELVYEFTFELLLATDEWHDGVFSEDRPAERAMWRSGRAGSEKSA